MEEIEVESLESLGRLSNAIQEMNQILQTINMQTDELASIIQVAERNLSSIYVPFQSAIYDTMARKANANTHEQLLAANNA